jgi:hypothetical protein
VTDAAKNRGCYHGLYVAYDECSFCIDESAHLHIVYLAAAGLGDLSHGEE